MIASYDQWRIYVHCLRLGLNQRHAAYERAFLFIVNYQKQANSLAEMRQPGMT